MGIFNPCEENSSSTHAAAARATREISSSYKLQKKLQKKYDI